MLESGHILQASSSKQGSTSSLELELSGERQSIAGYWQQVCLFAHIDTFFLGILQDQGASADHTFSGNCNVVPDDRTRTKKAIGFYGDKA